MHTVCINDSCSPCQVYRVLHGTGLTTTKLKKHCPPASTLVVQPLIPKNPKASTMHVAFLRKDAARRRTILDLCTNTSPRCLNL